ncbi:flagellar hook-length control protein FliK [Shewanella eurypsychrophilus]|uniref:Flagellar hook-length control protein FliK n=1 Tax=Shewanella eurypsychrophilus TaxID=2593656 RepID=A0ABX6V095_9GAMM|nr:MULTISPECIES: flagellar hook-length control protein FliK [Shewanella]QFU20464.1 hypothetical protein FS418_00300 [Shewanella sp. YLB-09]QPG56041.1 flagellar hook-length control protein FliK [Shewanella eurypsychrophilus]
MISSMADLRTTANNSDKLEKNITDAVEDLLSTEQGDFSVYASASLPQLQALNANSPFTPQSLVTHAEKLPDYAGFEGRTNTLYQSIDVESKANDSKRFINIDLPLQLTSERSFTSGYSQTTEFIDARLAKSVDRGVPEVIRLNQSNATTEQALVNQGEKSIFHPVKQSQFTAQPQPAPNQLISSVGHSLKGEVNPQANLMMSQILNVNSQITESDPATLAITVANRTQAAVSQWGPVSVSAAAPLAQQAQEMLTPLREQLRFQIDQKIKQAELRLDPPSLGKVELSIRLDGDRLHIQMHAANANVRDSLLMGLDRLREELAMDHGGQIELDIGQGEKHEQQDERHTAKIAEHQIEMLEPELPQQDSHLNNHIDLLA